MPHFFQETKPWRDTRPMLYLGLSRTRELYNKALALPRLDKLTAAQIMKEFLRISYNQKFITVPTTARHPSLYSARRTECLESSPSRFTPSHRQVLGHAATRCPQPPQDFGGPGYRSWYSHSLRAGRSGDRIPVGGEIFRTHPDRSWGSPSLLYNGYRIFPGGKAAGAWR